jgi:hypothetical protein
MTCHYFADKQEVGWEPAGCAGADTLFPQADGSNRHAVIANDTEPAVTGGRQQWSRYGYAYLYMH